IKQLIRNGRSASLQRTFKKSFTSFSHSTRNKTRDGLIRVRNIRALNGRFNTSITHAYSIVIGSKHITLNATGGGFLRSEERFSRNAETDLVCRLRLEKKIGRDRSLSHILTLDFSSNRRYKSCKHQTTECWT